MITLDGNQHFTENKIFGDAADVATADDYAQNMVIVKVNGDLTVDEGETIAQYYIDRSYKSDYVSYSQIIMVILSDPGVENVTNVLLNGGTQDIKLEAEEIPVVGENTWTVGESSV